MTDANEYYTNQHYKKIDRDVEAQEKRNLESWNLAKKFRETGDTGECYEVIELVQPREIFELFATVSRNDKDFEIAQKARQIFFDAINEYLDQNEG